MSRNPNSSINILKTFIAAILWLYTVCACSQDIPIAIKNAIVINGLGGKPLRGYDILIQKGKIVKVGKAIAVPKNAKVIDATGKTVIPGLIDMHGHLYAVGASQTNSFPSLYLAGGVTTIFSPGELDPEEVFLLKEEIRNDRRIGPDIFFAGPYFDSPPSLLDWMDPVADSVSLVNRFDAWKGRIDGIKVYSHISPEHFNILITKAKANKLIVTGHLGTLSTRYAVEHGIDGLEHGLFGINDFGSDPNDIDKLFCGIARLDLTSEQVTRLVELIVEKNVYVDPTLVIQESLAPDFTAHPKDFESYLDDAAKTIWSRQDKAVAAMVNKNDSCFRKALVKQRQFVALVYAKKGLLVAGTDPVSPKILPGFGIKKEIELFTLSGIPVVEAIKIASYNGARALRISSKTGSIEEGKNADLSIYPGDITHNIQLLEKSELVLKHGKIYYPDSLLMQVKGKVISGNWSIKK